MAGAAHPTPIHKQFQFPTSMRRHVWLLPLWLLSFMMELRSGLMVLLMVRAVSETRPGGSGVCGVEALSSQLGCSTALSK